MSKKHQKTSTTESDPTLTVTPLRRSARISNMSEDILRENSCTYTQLPAEEKEPGNFFPPADTPDGYVHFTFDDNEWCNLSNEHDPVSYRNAFSRPDAQQWQMAYEEELRSLCEHKVWDLVPHDQVPAGRKVIPSKPVFHYKHDSDQNIIRRNVCLVAKGFAQKPGIDYMDTYAPVACMESTRVLLHIGTSLDWEVHQMDIKMAFLHGNPKEEIFMEQPEGMKEPGKEDWVCYMHKTLWADASCTCMESSSTPCYA